MGTPEKIIVTGISGSGKTTMADKLGVEFGLPVTYMDRLFFNSSWKLKPMEQSLEELSAICRSDKWIIDSLPDEREEIFLSLADIIIFLDVNRFVAFLNIIKRRVKCMFRPRHETPDNSNNRLYPSFILRVLGYNKRKKSARLGTLKTKVIPGKLIIIKRVSKKTIPVLIEQIKKY